MSKVLRALAIWICCPIYKLIPSMYKIFYNLANYRLFEDTNIIEQLSANLYVLVSVIMLFAFSTTIISAIVNPDLLNDNKKGVAAIFKRSILGIVLMILVPFLFDSAYQLQKSIMDNALIEKILVGISYENPEEDPGGNGGQVIAGTLIGSVLYPNLDEGEDSITVATNVSEVYRRMVQTDISYIDDVADDINIEKSSGGYAFEFNGLVAIIAGGATVYILLLFALDMAIRLFKLAFLELTAPISIVAYMAAGDSIIKKWAGEVGKTFADVFIRIAAMAFYLFMLNNLPSIMNSFENENFSFILTVLIIVGLLIFIKQLPDFISKVFGANLELKGGIGGRLEKMAGVGDIAKKGWDAVKKAATTTALTVGGVGAGVATLGLGGAVMGGIGYGLAHRAWNKGFKSLGARPGKDTATGKWLRMAGSTTGSFLKSGNPISGAKAAAKSYEESDWGKQRKSDKAFKQNVKEQENFNKAVGIDANGEIKDPFKSKRQIASEIANDRSLSETQRDVTAALMSTNSKKATLDKLNSKKTSISDSLTKLIDNSTGQTQLDLEDLHGQFNRGALSSADFERKIEEFVRTGKISRESGRSIIKNLDGINNILENDSTLSAKFIDSNTGELKMNVLKSEIDRANDVANNAKTNYDQIHKDASSDSQKQMERYISTAESIDSKYNNTITGTKNGSSGRSDYASKNIYNQTATQSQQTNQSSTTTSTQSQQTSQSSTNAQPEEEENEDILNQIADAQIKVNEERINNAWKNQSYDDTYMRGTYEPQEEKNDDDYEDIFQEYYRDMNDDNDN